MARITLTRDEYTSGELPPVCVVCGEYTERKQPHEFSTVPLAIALWGFSLPWLCFIVPPLLSFMMLVAARTVAMSLPVCSEHQHHWVRRELLVRLVLAATWANGVLALVIQGGPVVYYGLLASWCFATVALFVLPQLEVRISDVDDNHLTLSGVHPEFVAAVERMREEPDAWPASR